MVYGILIYCRLKPQINLGIRIREVDKGLGGEIASYTVVRQPRANTKSFLNHKACFIVELGKANSLFGFGHF